MNAPVMNAPVWFGQRVKLNDERGDTGLRGYVVGNPRPARDENGPLIPVMVFESGDTMHTFGEHLLYEKRLEPTLD